MQQKVKFRSNFVQQGLVGLPHHFGVGIGAVDFGQDFLQRHQGMEGCLIDRLPGLLTIGQLHHPMEHANRHLLPADRTDALVSAGFQGIPDDAAFAMAIVMVFALLGKEFHGSRKFTGIPFP